MKIALCLPYLPGYEEKLAEGLADHQLIDLKKLDAASRLEALKNCDALFSHWLGDELTDEERGLLGGLKFVQTLSAGVETIRFHTLGKGTKLYSNVGAWGKGMAESCIGMIYANLRRFNAQKSQMKAGHYPRNWQLRGLADVKCLIWGWGGIGKDCAELVWKLGGHVSAVGRRLPEDQRLEGAYTFDQFDEALRRCDVLILAVPANKSTVGALDKRRLEMMPRNGMVVNLARARLINRDDLYRHLVENPDFTAALDVWWNEDQEWDRDPLINLDSVVPSAHNSEMTDSAWLTALDEAIARVNALARGEKVSGRVNYDDYC